VLSHDVAARADWITSGAVVAQNRRVAVQTREVLIQAWSDLLVGAIEHIVGLVGSVPDITPEQGGSNLVTLVWRILYESWSYLLALPAEEVLSMPVEVPSHPPGPPRTSPAT
jgi:hypothetical protein